MKSKQHKIGLLLILAFYWIGLNIVTLHAPPDVFKVANVEPQITAEITAADNQSMPIELPDDWYLREAIQQEVTYRISAQIEPHNDQTWAVYIPSVTHNAEVYVNGVWIGAGGRFTPPVARLHNVPLLFEFSPDLLTIGSNTLQIRVVASSARQGLLSEVYLAPTEQLRGAYEYKYFVRVRLIEWVTIGMFLLGAIVFCFWLARRQDTIYGLYALMLNIWAVHNLNLFVINIPVSAFLWEALTMSTLGWMVVLMIFFNHRFVGHGIAWVEKAGAIFAILGLGIFALPTIDHILSIGYGIWDSFLVVFGSYAIIHLIRAYWRNPTTDIYLMIVVGIPILVFGLHDILVVNHRIARTDGLIIQYSVIPAIMLFSWFLIRRFVQSINQAEELAANLEARVAEKSLALERQYRKLQTLEGEQILSQERERIMRDMHDGIGGQLIALMGSLQDLSGELYDTLRARVQASLIDLRLVIDSLDPHINDFGLLLGVIRPRIEEQLSAANIALTWQAELLPETLKTPPTQSLQLQRLVQEVITNAIKHANCQVVSVTVEHNDSVLTLIITDDGQGFNADILQQREHRGLRNMRFRAQQIEAVLDIQTSTKGTSVSIEVPLIQEDK